jgi:hypothetical protein
MSSPLPDPPHVRTSPVLGPLTLSLAFTTFVLLLVWGVFHHAMWRDEIQAWLIARDSGSLAELISNLRYEGHPGLWHIIVLPLTRLGGDPRLMHLPVMVCMAATVALVMWRAPFSWIEKMLFPFGYFPLIEYGVKARSYAVGVLLLTVFCCLWAHRRRHPVGGAAVLVLMAHVHVLFAVIAAVAALALVVARLGDTDGKTGVTRAEVAACLLFTLGWFTAVALPAHAAMFSGSIGIHRPLGARLNEIGSLSGLLWPDATIAAVIPAVALIAAAVHLLRRERAAQLFLVASIAGLIAVFSIVYGAATWHRGLVFVVFIAAVWIGREPVDGREKPLASVAALRRVTVLVLTIQVAGALAAVWQNAGRPLSQSRATAMFIRDSGWGRDPLVATTDYAGSAVVGHLGAARAYYANVSRWGSFVVWDSSGVIERPSAELIADIALVPVPHTLITAPDFPRDLLLAAGYREVGRFVAAREPAEDYVVYRR